MKQEEMEEAVALLAGENQPGRHPVSPGDTFLVCRPSYTPARGPLPTT